MKNRSGMIISDFIRPAVGKKLMNINNNQQTNLIRENTIFNGSISEYIDLFLTRGNIIPEDAIFYLLQNEKNLGTRKIISRSSTTTLDGLFKLTKYRLHGKVPIIEIVTPTSYRVYEVVKVGKNKTLILSNPNKHKKRYKKEQIEKYQEFINDFLNRFYLIKEKGQRRR